MEKTYKQMLQKLLGHVDIKINGNRPWDIKVKNKRLYKRILTEGSLGLGESYMDSWWECKRLDEFFTKVLRAELEKKVKNLKTFILLIKARVLNLQSISRSYEVGKKHYDIGNNVYKKMLDKRMVYSCGYWKKAKNPFLKQHR